LKAIFMVSLFVLILLGLSFSLPASAQPAVSINSVRYERLGFYNGLLVNVTNFLPSTHNLVIFTVWKNSQGASVAVTTAGLSLPSGGNGVAFAPLLKPFTSGNYVAFVFVVDTVGNPLSPVSTFSLSII